MRLAKGNFYVACHGLIRKNGKYLLTRRSDKNDFMSGYWDIPGGTIEFGEKLEQGLKREIKEESNIKIKPVRIIAAYTNHWPRYKRQVTQLTYLCDYVSGQVKLNPQEHSEYVWIKKKDIKRYKLIHFVNDLAEQF